MIRMTEDQKERLFVFLADCEKQNMTMVDMIAKLKLSRVTVSEALEFIHEYFKVTRCDNGRTDL